MMADEMKVDVTALRGRLERALKDALRQFDPDSVISNVAKGFEVCINDVTRYELGLEYDTWSHKYKLKDAHYGEGALHKKVTAAARELAEDMVSTLGLEEVKLSESDLRAIRGRYRAALREALKDEAEHRARGMAEKIADDVLGIEEAAE